MSWEERELKSCLEELKGFFSVRREKQRGVNGDGTDASDVSKSGFAFGNQRSKKSTLQLIAYQALLLNVYTASERASASSAFFLLTVARGIVSLMGMDVGSRTRSIRCPFSSRPEGR